MTIFRGPGGTGSASSDSDTTEFQEFLVQSQAARDAAQAAQAAAEAAEAAAEAAAGNVDAGVAASAASATASAGSATSAATQAANAASSASAASTSAANAASSATAASSSATAAAASAASINDADLVHKTGNETIGGVKTFTSSIAGSVTGTAANVTGTVAVANGGTGATTASAARTTLGVAVGTDVLPVNSPSYTGTLTGGTSVVNIGSGQVYKDASGNVGIGTSSPDQKLVVQGSNVSLKVADGTYSSFIATISSANSYGNGSAVGQLYLRGQAGIGFSGNSGGATQMALSASGNLQFDSGYGSAAIAYGCRAWVNFNGTGTVAIRASGNVSSITDNGTGFYQVNFTTAMPDAGYSANVTRARGDANGGALVNSGAVNVSNVQVRTMISTTAGSEDADFVFVSIFR